MLSLNLTIQFAHILSIIQLYRISFSILPDLYDFILSQSSTTIFLQLCFQYLCKDLDHSISMRLMLVLKLSFLRENIHPCLE